MVGTLRTYGPVRNDFGRSKLFSSERAASKRMELSSKHLRSFGTTMRALSSTRSWRVQTYRG